MPSTGKRLNASWLWGFVLTTLVARRPFSFGPQPAELGEAAVELHLKTGRTPFDVNSVYLKTGQRFRVALKDRTDCA
jgi:hypothetical protein